MDNHSHDSLLHGGLAVGFKRLGAACATVLAVLGGCATVAGGKSGKDVVAEKAQQRWDLLVKNDFRRGLSLPEPGQGSRLVTEQAYAAGFRRNFWTGAPGEGRCSAPTKKPCEWKSPSNTGTMGMGMKSPVLEKWIREKSDWWFVLER
jgi:hypothetical protein